MALTVHFVAHSTGMESSISEIQSWQLPLER
jgi:hypothetical protein